WRVSNWPASSWRVSNWPASSWRVSNWPASSWRVSNWPASSWRVSNWVVLVLALMIAAPVAARGAGPEGKLTWGVHVSLAPTWFDPAEMPGIITPYMVYYALHDAMVKPMPGNPFAPSLAESWSLSDDGLIYEFVLRKGTKFHNGEAITSEDVK